MTHINAIATPTNNTYYSCHYNYAVEAFTNHFTPLVINSLGDRHTKHTYTHHEQNQFPETRCKPATSWHMAAWFNNSMSFRTYKMLIAILSATKHTATVIYTNLNTGS